MLSVPLFFFFLNGLKLFLGLYMLHILYATGLLICNNNFSNYLAPGECLINSDNCY